MANILIVDDDRILCKMLSTMVKDLGHEVRTAFTLKDGIREASTGSFDVILLDVQMPDGNGLLEGLPEMRKTPSSPEMIIITGLGDPDGAELAIKSGAWDYIEKPSSLDRMMLPILRALQFRREKSAGKGPKVLDREGILGSSPKIKECLDIVADAAGSDANVLITGETGTGKELFAQAIHRNSPRKNRTMAVVDCAALPETLVESILFGHERGAFTGATRDLEGLISQADGGTLFLDEVGELSPSLQKAFLRVLQTHRFRPLGSKRDVESDFRLVVATNRDLHSLMESGRFREDFFFRLQAITIHLPPMRERLEDIREIVLYHVDRFCRHHRMETKGVSPEFLDALAAYHWPGNVRELVNVLERTLSLTRQEPTLFAYHLPMRLRIKAAQSLVSDCRGSQGKHLLSEKDAETGFLPCLQEVREAAERDYLQKLIATVGRDMVRACSTSGLSRARLYQLLKKHGIERH
jgi:two-component system NtrC family response regulator